LDPKTATDEASFTGLAKQLGVCKPKVTTKADMIDALVYMVKAGKAAPKDVIEFEMSGATTHLLEKVEREMFAIVKKKKSPLELETQVEKLRKQLVNAVKVLKKNKVEMKSLKFKIARQDEFIASVKKAYNIAKADNDQSEWAVLIPKGMLESYFDRDRTEIKKQIEGFEEKKKASAFMQELEEL
jgi:hypothetical protein